MPYMSNSVVLKKGDACTCMLFIKSGRLLVYNEALTSTNSIDEASLMWGEDALRRKMADVSVHASNWKAPEGNGTVTMVSATADVVAAAPVEGSAVSAAPVEGGSGEANGQLANMPPSSTPHHVPRQQPQF